MRPSARRTIACLALATGSAVPVALAATTSPRPCPAGYLLRQRTATRGNTRTQIRVLCLRTITGATHTVTRTVPTPIVSAPSTTTTTTDTASATSEATPSTSTVTNTVTAPAATSTQTSTVTQPQATTTATSTATQTITQTRTVAQSGAATLAWCGGHGGSWSASNCDAPPSPLAVSSGGAVVLDAETTGGLVSEPFPQGYLTFTATGPGTVTQRDQGYGINPDASQDCSRVENFSGQAEGACSFTFGAAGSYSVTVGFVDTDGNYGYPEPLTTTVNVG